MGLRAQGLGFRGCSEGPVRKLHACVCVCVPLNGLCRIDLPSILGLRCP